MTSLGTGEGMENVASQELTSDRRPVIGLDLSLTATGVCIIGPTGIRTHTVKSKPDAGTVLSFTNRCAGIVDDIAALTFHVADDALLVVEGLSMHSRSSSLDKIFASWYLILGDLYRRYGQEAVVVTPTQRAKYATGKGNASKDTVLLAVAARYGADGISDNNQADALILAAMGARALGRPIEDSLPLVNLTVMDNVNWGLSGLSGHDKATT